jgi:hypothetical protein
MDSILVVALRDAQITITSWRSLGARPQSLHLYVSRALLYLPVSAAVGEPIWPEISRSQASTRG